MKSKKMSKKKIIALAVALVVIIGVIITVVMSPKKENYNEITAKTKDITTYYSFSGNVQADTTRSVISTQSLKVKSVPVSEGDTVKAGDILVVLDSENLEEQIALKESAVEANNINLSYAYSQSKKNYEEAKEKYDNGMNPELNNATNAVDAAKLALDSAQKRYDDAQKNLNNESSAAITEIKSKLEPAKITYDGAKEAYYKELREHGREDSLSEVLSLEEKLTATQAKIDSAKDEMRDAQGNDKATVEAAAQRLNDAGEDYDEILEDIFDLLPMRVKAKRMAMEQAKVAYDEIKDTLNDTIDGVDSNLSDLKTALDNAVLNYDKAQTGLEIAELSVEQMLESYKAAMEKDEKLINNQPQLLELANLKSKLDDCIIRSDTDGTVSAVYAKEGSMAGAGQPVAEIMSNGKFEIKMKVDEYDVSSVTEGKEVTVYVNALDREITGTITDVSESAVVTGGISYFTATVSISDSDNAIKAGMSAEVKLLNQSAPKAITIPISALQFDEENKPYIFYKENGKDIVVHYVTVGINNGTLVEITDGLKSGETVYVPQKFMFNPMDMMEMM